MTTIIEGIEIEDDWVKGQNSYIKNYVIESGRRNIIFAVSTVGLNLIFEIRKNVSPKKWLISIYHDKISIAIDNFYNHSFLNQRFYSADEAMLYVDTFINKYNKLKVFL